MEEKNNHVDEVSEVGDPNTYTKTRQWIYDPTDEFSEVIGLLAKFDTVVLITQNSNYVVCYAAAVLFLQFSCKDE